MSKSNAKFTSNAPRNVPLSRSENTLSAIYTMACCRISRPFAFIGADNGSISEIVVHGDRLMVRRFNDAAHL